MVKPRFTTKIFLSYIIIILLISLSFAIFSAIILKKYYIKNIEERLSVNTTLVVELLQKKSTSLDEDIKELGRKIGERITIIDKSGNVLADSEKDHLLMENHALRPEVRMALRDGIGKSIRFSRTIKEEMLYLAIPSGDGGVVRLSVPLTEVKTAIYGLTRIFVFVIVIFCILSLFIAFIISRAIGRPISSIAETAEEIAKGNLEKRVVISSKDEIGRLASSFNRMAEELQSRIETITKEKNLLRTVLAGIIDAVFVVDKDGRIIVINSAFQNLFSETIGRYYYDVIRNEELNSLLEMTLSSGVQESKETTLYLPTEKIFYIYTTPMKDEKEVLGACTVMHDITEIKKLERMRIDFVANVSHELKTPLTAIQGAIETLKGEATRKESTIEFIDIIERQITRLGSLISDLLELSKIESKEMRMEFKEIDVKDVVKRIFTIFKRKAKNKSQKFKINLPEGIIHIRADAEKLEHAIANIVDNAIKFTPNRGEITLSFIDSRDKVRFEVEDTGPGIPPDDISRIFERFYRVDKTRSRKFGGTGLGLSIVKHIVEAHNGEVKVETELGKGSKFILIIPKK
ncbi:HAMP domain-containing protein [candidate division WOR-3 bacterium]|nr:HAMP domain-containing protein [candidate division WOR-3 bacterium]